ncbi:hypothetical protein [Brevibacillus borstelensis]|uniref:hypothetical protein n=1 Tax=Brevibacillus borstelensis TaxID=45462 RepID=UPI0030BDAD17
MTDVNHTHSHDSPRERDIELNRQRQLQEPYPAAAKAVDQIVAEKRAESPPVSGTSGASEELRGEGDGLETDIPSNYQASFGRLPKSLSSFSMKRDPGRL